jgi:hypothetical protein
MGQASWPKSSRKGIGVYTPIASDPGQVRRLLVAGHWPGPWPVAPPPTAPRHLGVGYRLRAVRVDVRGLGLAPVCVRPGGSGHACCSG